jgi:hypothetical protein
MVVACVTALSLTVVGASVRALADENQHQGAKHVLLLSIDGMHQSDLTWFVQNHPGSALARLVGRGVEFTVPSRQFRPTRFQV